MKSRKVQLVLSLSGTYDLNDFEDLLLLLLGAGGEFLEDLMIYCIYGGIFLAQDIINRQIQDIANSNQGGQGNLHPVVFDVADMGNIDTDLVGNVFLGVVTLNAAVTNMFADFFKAEFLHNYNLSFFSIVVDVILYYNYL